jgi:hypothetical protein
LPGATALRWRLYPETPVPGVHVNFMVVPAKIEPGVGVVSTAGAGWVIETLFVAVRVV